MSELTKLKIFKKGLIIHHWDTDGLCSAALMRNYLWQLNRRMKISLLMPKITNYFLTNDEYKKIRENNYDFIITVDINFQKNTISNLKKICPNIYIFDHHHKEPINKDVFYYNKPYPGCSYLINEYLRLQPNLLGIMGMVGDKEETIKKDKKFFNIVRKIMRSERLKFNQLLSIRNYLDSLYILEQRKNIKKIINIISKSIKDVLKIQLLKNNIRKINSEINRYLIGVKTTEKIIVVEIKSNHNIISQVTRNLSKKYKKKIILSFQKKRTNFIVYVRRVDVKIDMEEIVDFCRERNYSSGGKHEVVGAIVPALDWKKFKVDLLKKIYSYVE